MTEPYMLIIIALTYLLAGIVKGVIGMGLPLVSLTLLTALIGLHPAMALMLVPSFLTNVWQAVVGGHGLEILARVWPFLGLAIATVWIGAMVHHHVPVAWLTVLLGLLLSTYALINLSGWRFRIEPDQERWLGPLTGIVNGITTGMTGTNIVPGVIYLQALGFGKDQLIQALGIKFSVLTVALALAMHNNNLLTTELGVLSTASLLPAVVGMFIGQRYRANISEQRFQRLFFSALLIMGVFIGLQALAQ